MFPDDGVTKQQVADYYAAVMMWFLPGVVNRPTSVIRCPEGTAKACFFQKHMIPGLKHVGSAKLKEESGAQVTYIYPLDASSPQGQPGFRGTTTCRPLPPVVRRNESRPSCVSTPVHQLRRRHDALPGKGFRACVRQHAGAGPSAGIHRHCQQGATSRPDLRGLPAQQPRSDQCGVVFTAGASRRAGRHATALERTGQAEKRPRLRHPFRTAAACAVAHRSVGGHR